ncbi:hypothetical protein QZH41_000037 [Actinostola sp. cb2023]|nr:hypothetical protein QZH41_000037 [Actinostola sp. cb2023]
MGYCSSYDDVEIVNTAWAREMTARSEEFGVLVPSNISPGVFIQFAADNNDLNEETLDGKETTHATTLVAYQRQQFGPKLPSKIHADHSSKRRSLDQPIQSQVIEECSVRGKRPAVTSFLGKVDETRFVSEECPDFIDQKELAWFLLRLNQTDVLRPEDNNDEQTVPGWSAFNAEMTSVLAPRTIIGYCPIIAGSPTEYSTIYTVLKTVQEMTKSLKQTTAVVTFDLAIYTKAKEIQWRYPDEFKHLVIRMGGFHIALNFLAVIGKKYEESGIEDVLIESGLYGSNSTMALLKGKSYNRGVRAHKLLMEALLRLQWEAFCSWVTEEERANSDQLNAIINTYKSASSSGERTDAYLMLCNTTNHVHTLLTQFKQAASSKVFKFWDSYIDLVLLLLKFIRAEREGDWRLHLEATTEMIPHFFAMDRMNYSRWLPVYIMDMYQLEETDPDLHHEFISGNHTVSRSSSQPFNQVWTDMALAQSINRDSKTKGGIIGITKRPGALEKWFLTAHERAATTTAAKGMCGIGEAHEMPLTKHKESGKARVQRDEDDVKKVISTLKTVMSNPFSVAEGDVPLSNLATGVVLQEELSNRILNAERLGVQEMKSFLKKRMHTNEVGFWEPVHKMNIKTFASLSKKAKMKSVDEKLVTVRADRNLFGRLLIASKSRDINLREVLKYELTSVPCALAHADGSLRKTTKSVLLSVLEEEVESFPRLPVDSGELSTAYLIDGMAVVQMMRSVNSATFGELARKYFGVITAQLGKNGCNRVDVIFDRYDKEDSIKEGERDRRGSSSSYEVRISGPATPVPKKWNTFISNPVNKTNLKIYLSGAWKEMAKTELKQGEKLVLAGCFEDSDYTLLVTTDGESPLQHMLSDHEEADTRMLLHAQDCKHDHRRIVVQSPDTDVAVLCVYAYHLIASEELWFRTGVKDKLRFIPVHRLAEKLGNDLSIMLPAFHALTGCDTTSGLFQIGKRKAWKALLKNMHFNFKNNNNISHYYNINDGNCYVSSECCLTI